MSTPVKLTPGMRPPLMVLSPNDQGPQVSVATFIIESIVVIVVLVRLIAMLLLKRPPGMVDVAIWTATILGLVQSILVQLSIDHGLGRHIDTLSNSTFILYSKFHYASDLLTIIVLATVKMSLSLLIDRLTPHKPLKRANWIVMGTIGFWTIFSLFAIAFQCEGPQHYVYAPQKCAGEGALFYPIGLLNIITDIALVIIPIIVLWNVQLDLSTRSLVLGAFASRALVPIATIAQLAFISAHVRSRDPTWAIANVTICNQVMTGTSIITACMPALHHVLTNLSTGLAGTAIPEGLEYTGGQAYGPGYGYGYARTPQVAGVGVGGLSSKGSLNFSSSGPSRPISDVGGKYSRSVSRSPSNNNNNNGLFTNISITSQYSTASRGGRGRGGGGGGGGSRRSSRPGSWMDRGVNGVIRDGGDRHVRNAPGSSDSTRQLTMKEDAVVLKTDITVDIEEEREEEEERSRGSNEGGHQVRISGPEDRV